jgi:hypothetical protein
MRRSAYFATVACLRLFRAIQLAFAIIVDAQHNDVRRLGKQKVHVFVKKFDSTNQIAGKFLD